MTTRHAAVDPAFGIHPVVAATAANAAARVALAGLPNTPSSPLAVGHIVQQGDDGSLWVLRALPASTATNWSQLAYVAQPPLNYAGTALVLDATHVEGYIRTTNAAAVTITIPLNYAALDVGKYVSGIQVGAGKIQFVKGDPSIVINSVSSALSTRMTGSAWTLYKAAANEYDLSGDLS